MMLSHPDTLADLAALQRQDRLREVEMWQLARQARRDRGIFLHQLFRRLVAMAGQLLKLRAGSVKAAAKLPAKFP
jgi:hypothetical protein